ncbi:MAG: NDP-sugar synthase [Chloroflexi bacterium]|nr:NDP-sugar synthase [Chloroflexota bacterium]MDA1145466.1 NDP-sugar synthase [Chloroflexota bacterium]
MRAIVLVGGQGTRLRPLTWRSPKALVPVLNRPLLEHLLLHLKRHAITRITLAMTQRNAEIRDAFGDGSALGIQLEYAYEDTPLGSGGAIASVAQGWDEPFLVANGDIITDLDLTAMFAFHRERGAELTMHLHEVPDPSQFGVAVTAPDGRITRFVEKPPAESAPSNLINAGNWLFEPSVIAELDPNGFNRVEDGLFPNMCSAGRPIYGFSLPSYWRDIGNSEALRLVNLDLVAGSIPGRVPDGTNGVLAGSGTTIEAGANVAAPTVLGDQCAVAMGATVERTVCWDRVTIQAGATVSDSVLASGVSVGAGATIERSVVAHGARIAAGARVIDEQVEPDAVIEAAS